MDNTSILQKSRQNLSYSLPELKVNPVHILCTVGMHFFDSYPSISLKKFCSQVIPNWLNVNTEYLPTARVLAVWAESWAEGRQVNWSFFKEQKAQRSFLTVFPVPQVPFLFNKDAMLSCIISNT